MATTPGVDPERSARAVKAAATRAAKKAAAQQAAAAALANEQAGTGADAPVDVPAGEPAVMAVEVAVVDAPATVDQVGPVVEAEAPTQVAPEAPAPAKRAPRARASRARKVAAPAVDAQSSTEPVAVEPVAVEPVVAEPVEPVAFEPVEPVPAEPVATEPVATEPNEPAVVEPAARTAARRAPARTTPPKLDPMGAKAVDEARAAAVEVAGAGDVGEHLGVSAESDRVTVHRFATTHPGYRGWAWTVVLARIPRARAVTVSEVVLLPGDDALLAPSWVPWADRVEPGDLGQTDVLPYRDDDALLDEGLEQVPDGFDQAFSGDEAALVWELGLGRRRVLNREGRIEAATRWYRSDNGPDNAETRASDAPCSTCGYLVGMTGTFRQSFGVCANAWSPEDGRVVSMDHGCGAHSETGQTAEEADELPEPLIDDLRQELDTEPLPDERQSVDAGGQPGSDGERSAD